MAFVPALRVLETGSGSGTGNVTLLGAQGAGEYDAFNERLSVGDTCFYVIVDGNQFEVGYGTYSSATPNNGTLTRDTVIRSSGGTSKISLSGTNFNIFSDIPPEKTLVEDPNGVIAQVAAILNTVTVLDFDTLQDRALPTDGAVMYVRYGVIAGDGKGGAFYWSAGSTATPDNPATDLTVNTIQSNITGTGRWLRQTHFLIPAEVASDASVPVDAIARRSDTHNLVSRRSDIGAKTIPEVQNVARQATYATLAALKAVASSNWRQGDLIELRGIAAEGDIEPIVGTWQASSTNIDSLDRLFVRPDDIAGSNPGRVQFPESIYRNIPNVTAASELTIASGVITPTRASHTVDTEADAASDDLVTITATHWKAGDTLTLSAANDARTVVIKATGGNIVTPSAVDFELDNVAKTAILRYDGANWNLIETGGAGQNVADLTALSALGGFGASRDRERVYVKSLSTEYEYRDNLADATDDLIVVPALGGGTKKWGLPTYLKAQGIDLADLGVDPTGATDIYPVLLKAINAAKVRGGMVRFPGSGRFRLATTTTLDIAGVKLVGVGKTDRNTSDPDASIIEIRQSSVSPFTAGDGTVLEGLSFDYPDQIDSATPTTYAPLIDGTNWRHGGAYLCHVMRAWDFAHLGGALANQVAGALEFIGNRVFAINKTLRIRSAPEVIDLQSNHFSQNAFRDFAFPLLSTYSQANGIGVEIYDAASAGWGSVDGLTVDQNNFIFGKRIAFQISNGYLNLSQIGGLIDGCERWFQCQAAGRVVNTKLKGFGWADNANNSLLTAIELASTVDAENSLDVEGVDILNAGGTAIAVLGSPAGASHLTKLRVRGSSLRNFGADNLGTDRHGLYQENPKASTIISGCHIQGRPDETAHIGVFASAGSVHIEGTTIENLTQPLYSRGTAVMTVAPDVHVRSTKVNANNLAGRAYFTAETGKLRFTNALGIADNVFDVTQFGAVADGLQASAARNVAAFDAAVAAAAANGGGIVYWPASELEYYITDTRADTGDTFAQVCCAIDSDNIHVKGAGVGKTKIRLADAADAEMFRLGTRDRQGVKRSGVSDMSIDGNRANQAALQPSTHHFAGVVAWGRGANRSEHCFIENLFIKQTQYYGFGVESGDVDAVGPRFFRARNIEIEDTGADGCDFKNPDGTGYFNHIENIRVRRFGLAPEASLLSTQAGVDLRPGVTAKNIFIDDFGGPSAQAGIRIQRGGTYLATVAHGNTIENAVIQKLTGGHTITIGVNVTNVQVMLANIEASDVERAFLINSADVKATNCWSYDCVYGFRLQDGSDRSASYGVYTNCGSRGHTDRGLWLAGAATGNDFHGCQFVDGATGIRIEETALNNRFFGGRVEGNSSANLSNLSSATSGNVFINTVGITGQIGGFSNGNFTPTVTFATPGDFAPTYAVAQGRYMTIGPEVYVLGSVEFTANAYTTASGEFRIGGLPFAPGSVVARSAGNVGRLDNVDWPAGILQIGLEVSQGVTYGRLRGSRDANTVVTLDTTNFPASQTYRIEFSCLYSRA